MKYIIDTESQKYWEDSIYCVCWQPDMHADIFNISKKSLLRFISELNEINDFFILLLDNLSKINSIIHYVGEDKIFLHLVGCTKIKVSISEKLFYTFSDACKTSNN